jgi:predicted nucleic acid-binding protein
VQIFYDLNDYTNASYHINTIGSLGVLLVAKQRGLVSEIASLLLKLEKSDIYLSKQLIKTLTKKYDGFVAKDLLDY